MKYSTSRQKLQMMHEELDRQLEMAGMSQRNKRKTDRQQYRFKSELDDNKKSTLSNISNKPSVYDYEVRDGEIKSKKNQIGDLERKLKQLEMKMDNFSVSSGQELEQERMPVKVVKERLEFKAKIDTNPNEDTARFLLGAEEKDKEKNDRKFVLDYPSLPDESAEQEDSEDYFQIQQAIQKRKNEQKMARSRERESLKGKKQFRESREKAEVAPRPKIADRKMTTQTESHLRPKYSRQKSARSTKSIDKKPPQNKNKQSALSRKSVDKNKQPQSRGKRSDSLTRSIARNASRGSLNRSMDRSDVGEQITRGQEIQIAKQAKRVNNLQRELAHYKRLAKKYKEEVDDYKIMQIEFRQLKKNFTKSETIRNQQKKIIESLKSKMSR